MLSVDNLSVEFSARPLFADVSFVINKKDRIALVGKNGAGKSTLLKILSGSQQPTGGTVSVQNDITIGYLPQVMVLSDEHTVMEEAEKAFEHISEMQERIARMNDELASRTDYESADYMKLVERFTHESERFQMMGGMNYHAELERTYRDGYDLEDIRDKALALGMVPVEEVPSRTITVTRSQPKPERTLWDDIVWFFGGLFGDGESASFG